MLLLPPASVAQTTFVFIEKPLGVLATYCFAMYSYIAIWLMLLHTGSPTQHIWCIDAVQYW